MAEGPWQHPPVRRERIRCWLRSRPSAKPIAPSCSCMAAVLRSTRRWRSGVSKRFESTACASPARRRWKSLRPCSAAPSTNGSSVRPSRCACRRWGSAVRTGARGEDLGYVGRIVATDVRPIDALLDAGFLPIVAPLAIARDGSHAYNVNADLAAAALAGALRADAFVAITNVPRVFRDPDDPSSGIDALTPEDALRFAAGDACRSSMKPKLQAAARAVRGGAGAAYICSAKPNEIAGAVGGDATVIRSDDSVSHRAKVQPRIVIWHPAR